MCITTLINVVTGFLESGKTMFIQNLLSSSVFDDWQKTVLLLCEQGMEEYDEELLCKKNVVLIPIHTLSQLKRRFFEQIIEQHAPTRILIEYNGTWKIGDLLKIPLPRRCRFHQIIGLVDASTFEVYMANMAPLMAEQLSNCNTILINRYSEISPQQERTLARSLKNLNRRAQQQYYRQLIHKPLVRRLFDDAETGRLGSIMKAMLVLMPLWFFVLLLKLIARTAPTDTVVFFQSVNTIFISILLQALPFILLGIFISSVLQVFVPDDVLIRLFRRRPALCYPLAIALGICFPVCDCAMVPVASRLVRKGVPLSCAVTFLLAAPAVNPVVIFSTIYAFPGRADIVLLRIGTGVLVALAAGLLISRTSLQKSPPVNKTLIDSACASGYIGDISSTGFAGKIQALLRHTGQEFFNMTRYVVAGALISSILQVAIPKTALASFAGNPFLAVLAMLAAAFLMSVCATSNAFIGRSFSFVFPMGAALAFMVMGPMLDLKNLLMLSAGFQKRFILLLVGILLAVACTVFPLLVIGGWL